MEQITVQILGREYRLSCEPAERDKLLAAVAHVDAQMNAIRDSGKVAGTERIAVFAALNIAAERLAEDLPASASGSATTPVADPEIVRRMQSINALLDIALGNQERLF